MKHMKLTEILETAADLATARAASLPLAWYWSLWHLQSEILCTIEVQCSAAPV